MADVPAYVIANFDIHDADTYRTYEKGFFPLLKRYQGEFFTFDDNTETFEGTSPRTGRMVIFKFPSAEKARAWYADEDYQALSEYRRGGTSLHFLTMVNGLPGRD